MEQDSFKQLSSLVQGRLPEFVRVDHPTLVAFLAAYYEWLQIKDREGKIMSPMVLQDVLDIDSSMGEFITQFKKEYLLDFPEQLAISKATGKPVDAAKLMKNIKSFYRAKGTEKSFEFLFRILYDTAVEFYYPKKDILRVSDAKWYEKVSIKASNSLGDRIFDSVGRIIYQRDGEGKIRSSAKVTDVTLYQQGPYEVAELVLLGRNGSFSPGSRGFQFDVENETLRELRVYSVVASVTVSNGGSGYSVGDKVMFTSAAGDSGEGAVGAVSLVTSAGEIRKIKLENFGINYQAAPTVSVQSLGGSGFSGTAVISSVCSSEGYYLNSDGRLSTSKVLQDNHYYQDYSYVLKTEIVVDEYRDALRRLVHPAGLAMFGQVLIKRCSYDNLMNSSALIRYEVPIIGNYIPYTFNTFDNLQDWFSLQGTGASAGINIPAGYNPDLHDPLIRFLGLGNPITNVVDFFGATGPDFPPLGMTGVHNADPFWIVYEHPNRKIKGPVIAQVWRDQATEFITWDEWCSVTGGSYRGPVSGEWLSDFLSDPDLEKKYVFLNYSNSSEFRKITARSFFEMPIGEDFDCRVESRTEYAKPKISITSPLNASSYVQTGQKKVFVNFTVKNFENSVRFGGANFKVTIDGSSGTLAQSVLLPLYSRSCSFSNITLGSHLLQVELVDSAGRVVSGTSDSTVFVYTIFNGNGDLGSGTNTNTTQVDSDGGSAIDIGDPIDDTNSGPTGGGGQTGNGGVSGGSNPCNFQGYDFNNDGVVDAADLGLLLGARGIDGVCLDSRFDANCDGLINGAEIGGLLGVWTPPDPTGDGGDPGATFTSWDFDGDGIVNGTELGLLLGAWGSSDPRYDFNGDGVINGAEIGGLLGAWGTDGRIATGGGGSGGDGGGGPPPPPPEFRILVDEIPTTGILEVDDFYRNEFANLGVETYVLVGNTASTKINGVNVPVMNYRPKTETVAAYSEINKDALVGHLVDRGIQPNTPTKKYVSLNLDEYLWDAQVMGYEKLGDGITADDIINGPSNTYVTNQIRSAVDYCRQIFGPNLMITAWGYPYMPFYFGGGRSADWREGMGGQGSPDPNGPWWSTTAEWKEKRIAWATAQFSPMFQSFNWANEYMYDFLPTRSSVEAGLAGRSNADSVGSGPTVLYDLDGKGEQMDGWRFAHGEAISRIKTLQNKGSDFEHLPSLSRSYGSGNIFYYETFGVMIPAEDHITYIRKLKQQDPNLRGVAFWNCSNYSVNLLPCWATVVDPDDPSYIPPDRIPEWAAWFKGTLAEWQEWYANDLRGAFHLQKNYRDSYIRLLFDNIDPTQGNPYKGWTDPKLKIELTKRYNDYTLDLVRQVKALP